MRPPELTLANWDLGGSPSTWAYRNAGELFPHVEIPPSAAVAELEHDEMGSVGRFPVDFRPMPLRGRARCVRRSANLLLPIRGEPRMEAGTGWRTCVDVRPGREPDVAPALRRRLRVHVSQHLRADVADRAADGPSLPRGAGTRALVPRRVPGSSPALHLAVRRAGEPWWDLDDTARPGAIRDALHAEPPSDRGAHRRRHVRTIHARCRPSLLQRAGLGDQVLRAFGDDLPRCASRQWNFVWDDGDMLKGGFGGRGLYVSPARDLVIAFVGTPAADGSVNGLRWICRRLATTLFQADPSTVTRSAGPDA